MFSRFTDAVIEPAKLRDCLLSPVHPIGRFKSRAFAALVYSQDNWQQLRSDILALAHGGKPVPGQYSPHGCKLEVSGMLIGPSGRRAHVTTIWIVRPDDDRPRFVTAFPR